MRRWLVLISLVAHLGLVLGLFIAGFWKLEQLDRAHVSVALAQPLPPPPAPSGGAAPTKAPTFTHKTVPNRLVQIEPHPVEAAKPIAAISPGGGEGSGIGSGKGSGDPDSTGTCTENCGPGAGSAAAEKPVEVVQHHNDLVVPPTVLRALRISGETQIHPSDVDKTSMLRDGKDRVTAMFKTCVTEDGAPSTVSMMKSSGYPAYDGLLVAALRGWVYRPYEIGGQRVAACGVVTFVYEIR